MFPISSYVPACRGPGYCDDSNTNFHAMSRQDRRDKSNLKFGTRDRHAGSRLYVKMLVSKAKILLLGSSLVFAGLLYLNFGIDANYKYLFSAVPKRPFTVCTYFEPLGLNMDDDNKTREMLEVWRDSWSKQGWETKVLTEKDAALHPNYTEIKHTLLKLPTVNSKEYELSCYLRWVAVVASGCKASKYQLIMSMYSTYIHVFYPWWALAVDVRCGHGKLRFPTTR